MRIEEDMPSVKTGIQGSRGDSAHVRPSGEEISQDKKRASENAGTEDMQGQAKRTRRRLFKLKGKKEKIKRTFSERLHGERGAEEGNPVQGERLARQKFVVRDYLDPFGIFIVCAAFAESIFLILFSIVFQSKFSEIAFPSAYPPVYVTAIVGGIFPFTFAFSALYYGKDHKEKSFRILMIVHTAANLLWCIFFFACRFFIPSYLIILANVAVTARLLLKFAAKNNLCFYLSFLKSAFILYFNVINYCIIMLN